MKKMVMGLSICIFNVANGMLIPEGIINDGHIRFRQSYDDVKTAVISHNDTDNVILAASANQNEWLQQLVNKVNEEGNQQLSQDLNEIRLAFKRELNNLKRQNDTLSGELARLSQTHGANLGSTLSGMLSVFNRKQREIENAIDSVNLESLFFNTPNIA